MNSKALLLAAVCVLGATAAMAEPSSPEPEPEAPAASPAAAPKSTYEQGRDKAADIVSQPVRDVGVDKAKVPPPLVRAVEDPYGLGGLKSCKQIAAEINDLTGVLGPDFGAGSTYRENRTAKLAEAGGASLVNSLIPFRGLVREASGAAPAERKFQAAVQIGYARRGFLRGVYLNRRCKPAF